MIGSIVLLVLAGTALSSLRGREETASEAVDRHSDRPLGTGTTEYLASVSAESFKRQIDLEESIWRSLPFFAAAFAFVAALVARAADDSPAISSHWFPIATHALLAGAVVLLGATLRYFSALLRARQYQQPAQDAEIAAFAQQTMAYHRQRGRGEDDADHLTRDEMRAFMTRQYGDAASINFDHNAARIKARSKVLLCLLLAFLLAFLCEALIFVTGRVRLAAAERSLLHGQSSGGTVRSGAAVDARGEKADTASAAARHGRDQVLGPAPDHSLGTGQVTRKAIAPVQRDPPLERLNTSHTGR